MAKTRAMPEPDADDSSLLRDYCASRDERAFRALVERHLPAVWSAARRLAHDDAALADDIAQEVFAHLAAYAPKLPPRVVLGGWLHRHTCFTAKKALRAAARRRARERTHAAAMTASTADPWPDIAPHLDAALNSLPSADRDAVVLRFFEKRDFRTIAATLGTSEDAARMRTARALEKLRGLLGKRSALLTVALLTSLLAEKSIATPSTGLASQIVQSSLARATAPSAAGLAALLARLLPHRATIAGVAVLCVAGFAVWQWHGMLNAPSDTPRVAVASSAGKTKAAPAAAAAKAMEVTVHFILVPEAEAAAVMANRWTSDADNALLSSLLQRAGPDPKGIHVARTFTGIRRSGQRSKFENIKEFAYPTDFDPGEKGMITPEAFSFRNVGSTAEMELTVSDGDLCDVNLAVEHHYAEPLLHHFGTSLANPEDENLPGAKQPEMRVAKITTQLLMEPGTSQLAGCSQLPHLPDAPEASVQRLFTFITIEPSAQP